MSVPRFLADEDLRFEIVVASRRLEPAMEFATLVELGRTGVADADVLAFAQANRWIVVSHDVNTIKGLAEARIRDGTGIAGLMLVRQSAPTRTIAESLLLVWSASEPEEWIDHIVFLPL